MELRAKSDRARTSRQGAEQHFVTVSFEAPELVSTSNRLPVDMALVLDHSGSLSDSASCEPMKDAATAFLQQLDQCAHLADVLEHESIVVNALFVLVRELERWQRHECEKSCGLVACIAGALP